MIIAPPDNMRDAADAAGAWLFGRAIPLWLEHGVDWHGGGCFDALDPATLRNCTGFKRLRVVTRQIYVFAQGATQGVPRAGEGVAHGLAFLLGRMRHPRGGFASRCALDGTIIDPARDLYDQAFVLFALAHAHRLTGDATLRDEALALLGFIGSAMRHPAGGYVESIPDALPRRQNPHMHLLEAALACAELMPDPAFDALCDELAGLFETRFLAAGTGVLPEYYSADLVPERRDGRLLVEPGHQLEWAWLLAEHARVRGRAVAGGAALARFALRHGLDGATGLLRGALYEDGGIASAAVRLWPHAEWLKASLVPDGAAGDPATAWAALACFLTANGLWHEHWDPATRAFPPSPVPASSLYHITTAVMALRDRAGTVARRDRAVATA